MPDLPLPAPSPAPADRRALLQNALQAIEDLQARLDAAEAARREPIAIIGLSCRFPGGADGPERYWQLLKEGRDAIREAPADRWDPAAFTHPGDPHPPRWFGGFLDGIDQFDPEFFGISPREATTMDPQQRLVLQVGWEALERAGILSETLLNSQTGVFLGITTNDYSRIALGVGPEAMDVYTATGSALNVAAGRLAYTLGLHGPCMAIDTACSSSLTAIHLACQALRNRECDLALSGGVNALLSPEPFVMFSRWGMMAPDGRCKTFDAAADGFVRAEGCGMLVLKRLSDAQRDGDAVLALIRGSAVNEDGKSSGLTVPNGPAQQAVIRAALDAAGVAPAQIGYVEAHGTGTSLGDPIEVEALGAVLGAQRTTPLVIGSVKTNIGHAESASGVAGLIKTVLAMQHEEIPAHLHFHERSPRIPWPDFEIQVPTSALPWPRGEQPRFAGVSSFGFSGVNAHIVLEEAPAPAVVPDDAAGTEENAVLLPLSARSDAALVGYTQKLADFFEQTPAVNLADAAATQALARTRFAHRLAVVARTPAEATAALRAAQPAKPAPAASAGQPKIAFLFTGQGAQYTGMGWQLFRDEPVFRQALERCAAIFQAETGESLLEILFPDSPDGKIDQTTYTQPALFALEYALAALWQSWGVRPQAVMGHSLGEYVAATVAGVFSVEDGLRLVIHRARLMGALPVGGQMAAVFAPREVVEPALQAASGRVTLAALNGPENVVISGPGEDVQAALAALAGLGVQSRPLTVSHAFHSPLMQPIADEFARLAGQMHMALPQIALISNTSAAPAGEDITRPTYWRRQILEPVRFAESIETLRAQGIDTWVEIGPHPTLLGMAARCLPAGDGNAMLPSLRKGQPESETILASLGALFSAGLDFAGPWRKPARWVSLPTYPFQGQRYWVENAALPRKDSPAGRYPLIGPRLDLAVTPGVHIWQGRLELDRLAYFDDHRVQGLPILPLTAYVEMAIEAAADAYGSGPLAIREIEIKKVLALPPQAAPLVQVSLAEEDENHLAFAIYSRAGSPDTDSAREPWSLHASGKIDRLPQKPRPAILDGFDARAIQERCSERLEGAAFYQAMTAKGNQWGPNFQGVEQIWRGENEALSRVRVPAGLQGQVGAYIFHPAVSDASGHVLTATLPLDTSGSTGGAFVGGGIQETRIYQPFRGETAWAYARLRPQTAERENVVIGDVAVYDTDGNLVSETIGARLWYLEARQQRDLVENVTDWMYEPGWEKLATPDVPRQRPQARWLVFANPGAMRDAIVARLAAMMQSVQVVFSGTGFSAYSDGAFQVDPRRPEDFSRLIAECIQHSASIEKILYLWGLEQPGDFDDGAASLMQAEEETLGGVLHLAQALYQAGLAHPPKIWLVTRGTRQANSQAALAATGLWGFGRSLAAEHSEIWGGLVDLDAQAAVEESAETLLSAVLAEDGEDQVAFTGVQRLGLRLERHHAGAMRSTPVHPVATYWISGGLGGLGLQVAGWLVERGARHIVLFSRSTLPERSSWGQLAGSHRHQAAVSAIAKMEAQGAQIWPAAVDVSDPAALSAFWQQFQASGWPAVRGVVHAAGMMQYQALRDHTLEDLRAIMRPKVAGGWQLHQLLRAQPLDFFVLFSSTSALLSSPLMASYAAANTFLDGFARYRRAHGLPATSINWGTWGEAGMAVAFAENARDKAVTVAGTLSNRQALQALERLLIEDAIQVGVMPMDWGAWQKLYPAFTHSPYLSKVLKPSAEPGGNGHTSRIDLAALLAEPQAIQAEQVEAYLARQTGAVLGYTGSIDREQSISSLGLDSLMAVELKNRIETDLKIVIPMVQLIEGPSVRRLTGLVMERLCQVTLAEPDGQTTWEEGEL